MQVDASTMLTSLLPQANDRRLDIHPEKSRASRSGSLHPALPLDMEMYTYSFCGIQDLCRLASVSSNCRKLSSADKLWLVLFVKFPQHMHNNPSQRNWKRHYFYKFTLEYRCELVYQSQRESNAFYNRRYGRSMQHASTLISTAVLVCQIFVTSEFFQNLSKDSIVAENMFLAFWNILNICANIFQLCIVDCCRAELDPLRCFGRYAHLTQPILTGALDISSIAATAIGMGTSIVSNKIGLPLLALNAVHFVTKSLLFTRSVGQNISCLCSYSQPLGMRIADAFNRLFRCQRRYL